MSDRSPGRGERERGLARVALLIAAAGLLSMPASRPLQAQETPPDSSTVERVAAEPDTIKPDPIAPEALPEREPRSAVPVGRDRDRFEWGVAVVDGPFDMLGTFGYHRVMRVSGPFEHAAHVELAGGKVENLTEGSASVGYLLRPLLAFRRASKLRPLFEVGPAAHIVVQVADIEGFGETAFHSHAYLKTHAYAGFEALLGERWGIVLRGRFSVPAHRPLDYAQAAIFLR